MPGVGLGLRGLGEGVGCPGKEGAKVICPVMDPRFP